MHGTKLLGSVLTSLLLLTASPALGQRPPPARASARQALLSELRTRLDRLERVARNETVLLGGDLDVGPLVGMHSNAIRRALGTPRQDCRPQTGDERGNFLLGAPCRSANDMYYVFYRIPLGIRGGGGPQLLLQFDAAGVCTSATWRFTR